MDYYRTQRQFNRAQAAYDEMLPPEYWEDDFPGDEEEEDMDDDDVDSDY